MADRITLEQLHADIKLLNTDVTRKLLYIDESLIDRPETTRAYIERHHHWARLLEVVSSIPQLVSQRNTVPLVGFLGHFSSGKSSLINALLKIDRNAHPSFKRPTGEHPTDKGITLITHFDHFVEVRQQFPPTLAPTITVIQGPSAPLLEHMTLVDTPGLGDNPAEMELVIQFLHLVHVLVLPVHGRQPFADSDKAFALLNLAFNGLAGVPKIFVVTNADHFLKDRHGEFDTDWDKPAADRFWRDTLMRLEGDSRFHAHREALTDTKPIFVDSVYNFHIDELRNILLPIVQDGAQRTRTDAARIGYVFRSAAVALRHLETYITERSRHLAVLRQQAEERSQNTETAIEVLISDLSIRLNSKLQSLPVDPQRLATLNDPLSQIVTVNTIQHAFDVNNFQSLFQKELNSCGELRIGQVVRRAFTTYDQRRDNPEAKYQSEVLTDEDVERVVYKSGLHRAMKQCAQMAAHAALIQYRERLRTGLDVLENPSDRYRVEDFLRDVREELERFERKHDDSVKGLFAYVTQPGSMELLREHGFVTFDAAGNRRVDPASIDVYGFDGVVRLQDKVNACKNELREIYQLVEQLPDRTDRSEEATTDDNANETSATVFEIAAMKSVLAHIAQQVANAVSGFDSGIQAAIDNMLNETRDREREQEERIRSIRAARRGIALRVLAVMVVVGGIVYALKRYQPELLAKLWREVPESVVHEVLVKSMAGLIVAVVAALITFVWVGISNPALKTAFSSITRLRLRTWWQRRKQRSQLRSDAKALLQSLPTGFTQLDIACLGAIIHWIQTRNADFIEVHGHLAVARERVNQRAQTIRQLVAAITPWVNNLPRQLLERSQSIRQEAIADHMVTIREAADSVETLRSNIVRIAESAEVSAP
jgi:predicted GTPase